MDTPITSVPQVQGHPFETLAVNGGGADRELGEGDKGTSNVRTSNDAGTQQFTKECTTAKAGFLSQ